MKNHSSLLYSIPIFTFLCLPTAHLQISFSLFYAIYSSLFSFVRLYHYTIHMEAHQSTVSMSQQTSVEQPMQINRSVLHKNSFSYRICLENMNGKCHHTLLKKIFKILEPTFLKYTACVPNVDTGNFELFSEIFYIISLNF